MLYVNNNQEVILEVTTEDGYNLTPDYNHDNYITYGLLQFSELTFYNDFKQGYFGLEDGVHFTVTKTISLPRYYQTRIPKVFSWNNKVYTLGEDVNFVGEYQVYFDSSYRKELFLSPKFVLNHSFEITVECWTCANAIEHPVIKRDEDSQIIQTFYAL